MTIEIAYKKIGEINTDGLIQARQLELDGNTEQAAISYASVVRDYEIQLFTENWIDTRWSKDAVWRDELLAKIELAKGKQKELAGESPVAEYKRSQAHYRTIADRLSHSIHSDLESGYAIQATIDLGNMLRAHGEKQETDADLEGSRNLEVIANMPSTISEMLKPRSFATWGMHWSSHPEDIVYGETPEYKVVVAKWDEHEWGEGGGGIQWNEWLSIYFTKKGNEEILCISTEKIVTRDMNNSQRDRNHLWKFNHAGLEVQEGNNVKVSWQDKDGETGPSYTLNLDDEVTRIESEKKSK